MFSCPYFTSACCLLLPACPFFPPTSLGFFFFRFSTSSSEISSRSSALPIEYLPAQYIDLLNVELRIVYNGRATNNIAVGDPLMFTLEARGGGFNFGYYSNDIFATNVIARDPYSGRSILLIDDRG